MKNKRFITLLFIVPLITSCTFVFGKPSSDGPASSTGGEDSSFSSSSIDLSKDPYENVDEDDFYRNYTPATSFEDSYFRTKHNLMSGSIESQDYLPSTANSMPMDGSKYIFNSASGLSADGLSYRICDENGKIVKTIYKGGAYVTLNEVAAYLQAFADIPANYISSNKTSALQGNPWGKYLRLNHSYFSMDTSRYPYEPELPDNADYKYFEIDVGTTGTPSFGNGSYASGTYNNGNKITRGAARICYTHLTKFNKPITDPMSVHVFYTYNHYNDFQEYLNYEGGWGKRFGNMTGGGPYNTNSPNYKTSYPEVTRSPFYD